MDRPNARSLRPTSAARTRQRVRETLPTPTLIAVGVLLELTLLLRLGRPASLVRLPGPQLAGEPVAAAVGLDGAGLAAFLLTLCLLIGLYAGALALAAHVPPAVLLPIAGAFGVLYALTLWPTIALGSTDLYHYILDGRTLAVHGANPLMTPPHAVGADPLAGILFHNAEYASAYGPLFYLLAGIAARLGQGDLVWSTLAMKGLALLWLFGCFPLVYRLGEQVRTGGGAVALLVFAWNPLILFEVAGSGHNDIGVTFFGLLALSLAAGGQGRWAPAALVLGALVKLTALLLAPALLMWMLRQRVRPAYTPLLCAWSGAALLMVLAYLPLWAGGEALAPLRRTATLSMSSPAAAAVALLSQTRPPEAAVWAVKLGTGGAFLLSVALVLARTRGPRLEALVAAAFWCTFAYLMLAAWWFWPWYVVPLVALGAVLWPGRAGVMMAIFSASALLLYVPLGWRLLLFTYENALSQAIGLAASGFLAPALTWALGWRALGERQTITHEPPR